MIFEKPPGDQQDIDVCDICLREIKEYENLNLDMDLSNFGMDRQLDLCPKCDYLSRNHLCNIITNSAHSFKIKVKVLELEERGYKLFKHNRLLR